MKTLSTYKLDLIRVFSIEPDKTLVFETS